MKSITIHGLDENLDRSIRERARKKGLSINKTIKEILRQTFGNSNSIINDRRDEFRDLSGVWSTEDVAKFKENLTECESVDVSDWQ